MFKNKKFKSRCSNQYLWNNQFTMWKTFKVFKKHFKNYFCLLVQASFCESEQVEKIHAELSEINRKLQVSLIFYKIITSILFKNCPVCVLILV